MTEKTESPEEGAPGVEGSIADELGKLWLAVVAMAGDVGTTADTIAPACNGLVWCPVCRGSNLLKQCSPEVVDHLASAARSLLLAVTTAVKTDQSSASQGYERITLVDDTEQPERSD